MMPERSAPPLRQLVSVGCLAKEALTEGASGQVTATFQSSAYLQLGPAWLCIGLPSLGAGPLNLLAPLSPSDLETLSVGDPVTLKGGQLRIGSRLRLSLAGAAPWQPPRAPAWDRATLGRGLAWLDREIAAGRLAVASPLLGADPSACGFEGYVAETAQLAIAGLDRWLAEAWETARAPAESEAERIAQLIGLGPGLTPAGDDFLGGMLVALTRLARADLAAQLQAVVLPLLPDRSHPISSAHLQAAAEGLGSAALLEALNALLGGQLNALPDSLVAVGQIGHSSGWDALAGALLVLRCCRTAGHSEALSAF